MYVASYSELAIAMALLNLYPQQQAIEFISVVIIIASYAMSYTFQAVVM